MKAEEFEQSRIIKFVPLDACRFELMRFKTLYEGDELPFAVKSIVTVQGAYVELQAFVNMTPAAPRSPYVGSLRSCNNIMIHFPVPAQWIKALWTRNLQRQKSLKAKMNRRACLGSLQEPESEPVIQVTVGSAKYESTYRAVVWKIDRLPDKNSSKYPAKKVILGNFHRKLLSVFTSIFGPKQAEADGTQRAESSLASQPGWREKQPNG